MKKAPIKKLTKIFEAKKIIATQAFPKNLSNIETKKNKIITREIKALKSWVNRKEKKYLQISCLSFVVVVFNAKLDVIFPFGLISRNSPGILIPSFCYLIEKKT